MIDEATLIAKLRELWGYDDFREGQLTVISQVMSGQDTLALMPTGAGKSLCYQLPAMLLPGVTLVISPLIALMKDQYDNLPAGAYEQATFINSSLETSELERRLDEMVAGRYKLVYAAPERLRQRPFLDALCRAGLHLLVIDEAHCVSLWGHDFRPDYLFIRKTLPLLGDPQLLGLTATATPQMQREIGEQLGRKLTTVLLSSFRPNLRYEVKRASNAEGKMRLLVDLCKQEHGSGIVYATSRDNCEKLAEVLRRNGIKAEFYHAGLESEERSAVQERFMLDRTRVIVATVAFGMGIDKANVRFIAHYNMPKSLESYAQESGRAGRDGKPARCVLFYSSADKGNLTRWARSDQLDKPILRAVYKAVRDALGEGVRQADGNVSGLVVSGDLVREVNAAEVGDVDETKLRVAISLLERAALMRRHLDAPRTATLLLNGTMFGASEQDMEFERFCQQARLRPGEREVIDVMAVSRRLGLELDELEAKMLAWQAGSLLQYRGGGRDMVLALNPNPPNAAARIDDLLGQLDRAMEQRLSQMEAYAEANVCRHQAIARHLGENLPPCGDACDVCTPSDEPAAPWEEAYIAPVANVGAVIMEAVRALPYPLGRTGLGQALVGSAAAPIQADRCANFGKLGYATRKEVTAAVDKLIEAGYLRIFSKGDYPLLTLGPQGNETPPPDLVTLRAKHQRGPSDEELDNDATDLFERLRTWRRIAAQRENVPPYIIAHDTTLRSIAQLHPHTVAELAKAYGWRDRSAMKYGEEVLAALWGERDLQPAPHGGRPTPNPSRWEGSPAAPLSSPTPSPSRWEGSPSASSPTPAPSPSRWEGNSAEPRSRRELESDQQTRTYARELRNNQTPAELRLWGYLRNSQQGVKFRRQQAIGNYVVDFCCLPAHLIVEIDGDSHAEQTDHDETRTNWLEQRGWKVIRFTNSQVLEQTEEVLKAVLDECQKRGGG